MNIYVETNFVQDLVFLQEQSDSCERILQICEEGRSRIFIPAFSIAEPLEKLHRQKNLRHEIQQKINAEVRQLARTSGYEAKIQAIKDLEVLFVQSIEDERKRFEAYRKRIIGVGQVLPSDSHILSGIDTFEANLGFSTQDAIVYASVVASLASGDASKSCFLNRNSKDFDIPEVREQLESYNCTMIPRFDDGLRYIEAGL